MAQKAYLEPQIIKNFAQSQLSSIAAGGFHSLATAKTAPNSPYQATSPENSPNPSQFQQKNVQNAILQAQEQIQQIKDQIQQEKYQNR